MSLPMAVLLNRRRIIRQIQRLHVKREQLNVSTVKRTHPELIEAVYAIKPFWGWKQALGDAGIPYNKINVELLDYCTCLICGAEAASMLRPKELIAIAVMPSQWDSIDVGDTAKTSGANFAIHAMN